MSLRKPRALVPGSRVAVVAAASPFSPDEFAAGLDQLRSLGFKPVVDPRVHERRRYVSGTPETRAATIMDMLRAPDVDGLIGARGGYGSAQLLPLLDPSLVASAGKPIIGYSDLTSLLQFVSLGCGLVSFHGPTVAGRLSRGVDGYDRASLLACVSQREPVGSLCPPGLDVLRGGEAAGPLFGGTLTQLCASLGTPFAFAPPRGFVLFVEDVNERPYRIDRSLLQLAQAGILDRAAAMVFGQLPGCDEPGGQPTARDVVADLVVGFTGPVLWGFPSGHTIGPAWTLPLGVRVRVLASPAGHAELIIEESAVE